MIRPGKFGATRQIRHAWAVVSFASSHGSRTAAYRRLSTQRLLLFSPHPPSVQTCLNQQQVLPSRSPRPSYLPLSTQLLPPSNRLLHASSPRFQQPRTASNAGDSSQEKHSSEAKTGQSEKDELPNDEADNEKSNDESSESKQDSRKNDPSPPPHGDKSPWQVFTETLRSEFKASKEWNESTKQLASSAHQFTESESVKRARAAYDATAGAASSRTAAALKTTGKALGQSAAWTWDTKVVQGIRGGVNATGRGIEKATRPVRETKAFQSIKEAVDDGSSSRYGGWVEKEERRKKKELRDLKEVQSGSRPSEGIEEDPKYGLQPSGFGISHS
jgi:mitochondrial import inner membrane translocase subunit TIM44